MLSAKKRHKLPSKENDNESESSCNAENKNNMDCGG